MKEVKLKQREPSKRLKELFIRIDFLGFNEVMNCIVDNDNNYPIYNVTSGFIAYEVLCNKLLNNDRLTYALNDNIKFVTEDSFCELLEEHLYLEAKQKMEELLPQIQAWYSQVYIVEYETRIIIACGELEKNVIVEYNFTDYEHHCYSYRKIYAHIWEDMDKLIVKKPKPWWETVTVYWKIEQQNLTGRYSCRKINLTINKEYYKSANISRFKTEEEAQAMCDKLNAVLKGEE